MGVWWGWLKNLEKKPNSLHHLWLWGILVGSVWFWLIIDEIYNIVALTEQTSVCAVIKFVYEYRDIKYYSIFTICQNSMNTSFILLFQQWSAENPRKKSPRSTFFSRERKMIQFHRLILVSLISLRSIIMILSIINIEFPFLSLSP